MEKQTAHNPLRVQRMEAPLSYEEGSRESDLYRSIRLQRSGAMISYNSDCLKCGAVEKEMVRAGALHFCLSCYREEFQTRDPAKEEREEYLDWLKVYRQKHS